MSTIPSIVKQPAVDRTVKAERVEAELVAKNAKTEKEKKAFKKKRTVAKLTPKRLFEKFIYKWHPNFRFSARIICGHLVAFVALYYVVIEWVVEGVELFARLKGNV